MEPKWCTGCTIFSIHSATLPSHQCVYLWGTTHPHPSECHCSLHTGTPWHAERWADSHRGNGAECDVALTRAVLFLQLRGRCQSPGTKYIPSAGGIRVSESVVFTQVILGQNAGRHQRQRQQKEKEWWHNPMMKWARGNAGTLWGMRSVTDSLPEWGEGRGRSWRCNINIIDPLMQNWIEG